MAYGITLVKPLRTLSAIFAADIIGTFTVVCAAWVVAGWEIFVENPFLSLLPAAELSGVLAAIGLMVWFFIGLPIHMFWTECGWTALW